MNATSRATLDDYRWLVGPDAAGWLDEASRSTATVAFVERLRKRLPPERAHLVIEQVELRRRAAGKFAAASTMFFTATGLEQSSDQWVAAYKASRFPADVATADLCCGIGGDLLALACGRQVEGVDRDGVSALLAEVNAALAGHSNVRISCQSVESFSLRDGQAWHLDPDRRASGRRTTRLEFHHPGPETIERLLEQSARGAVKLAPASSLPHQWQARAEQEWIGRGGECRQLVAWLGPLGQAGARRATVLTNGGQLRGSLVQGGDEPPSARHTDQPERYLIEPDAAVLAAGLQSTLANRYGVAVLGRSRYLTAPAPIIDGLCDTFEVLETMPFDLKRLRGHLAKQGYGPLEIKARGVSISPEEIRRRLRLDGSEKGVLLVFPIATAARAFIARRVVRPAPPIDAARRPS